MSDDSVVASSERDAIERRESSEIRPMREQNLALELEVLMVRDWAAAQGLRIGDIRKQKAEERIHGANYRAHIARLEAALAEANERTQQMSRFQRKTLKLQQELVSLRSSTTWKVGYLLLTPVRILKRLLRRG